MEKQKDNKKYWLWVTRPEYYLDITKNSICERKDLDPKNKIASDGWWTCHKETRRGDLILLWRTNPMRDVGYLFQARSDAYNIADDDHAKEQGWDYGCDYESIYKFSKTLLVEEIRADPYLEDWTALRGRFQRRAFLIPQNIWDRLTYLLSKRNPSYNKFINNLGITVSEKIILEEQLEEQLCNDLGRLKKFGYNLSIYNDQKNNSHGRQLVCRGHGGRIDILAYDTKNRRFVVIELKNVCASQQTYGQISTYMGWVKENIAGRFPVHGLVISRGTDPRFSACLKNVKNVSHIDIKQIGFK